MTGLPGRRGASTGWYVVLWCALAASLLCMTQTWAGLTVVPKLLEGRQADAADVGSSPLCTEAQLDNTGQAPSQDGHVSSTGAALLSALEGRAYYLLADHVTCRANTPDRPDLQSWKNKLTFAQGKVLIWQTLCNDSPLVLDFDGRAFVLTPDLSSLTYEGASYTYYAQPPQLCDQGQWCPVEAPPRPRDQDGDGSQSTDTSGARQAK